LLLVLLCAGGIAVAVVLNSWLWSLAAYVVILLVGSLLIGFQRHLAKSQSQNRTGRLELGRLGWFSVICLVAGTMSNAWVFCLELARGVWVA
jgi:hypothetical protein